jgi:ATP-dependent RNA helicase RhlB
MKLLVGVLKHDNPASAIIFCNTKRSCEVVAKRLQMNEIKCDFLIGDLPQSKRLQILKEFKAGQIKVLVATDVAARGIDVDDLAMVINYDLPVEAENYVHRIGRTARAGKSGKAYTFCSEQDVYNLPAIERYIEMSIPSSVAYPEQMEEDKSAGVYIKTENWRDDNFENRGGYNKKGGKKSNYKSNGDKNKNYKNKDYKNSKPNYKNGKNDYKKSNNKKQNTFDFEKMQNMSFEERMKLYKEKYSSNTTQNQTKNNYKNKNYNKNNNNNKPKNTLANKKSLWQKIKGFFSK